METTTLSYGILQDQRDSLLEACKEALAFVLDDAFDVKGSGTTSETLQDAITKAEDE